MNNEFGHKFEKTRIKQQNIDYQVSFHEENLTEIRNTHQSEQTTVGELKRRPRPFVASENENKTNEKTCAIGKKHMFEKCCPPNISTVYFLFYLPFSLLFLPSASLIFRNAISDRCRFSNVLTNIHGNY